MGQVTKDFAQRIVANYEVNKSYSPITAWELCQLATGWLASNADQPPEAPQPREVRGVEVVELLDVTDAEIAEWLERHDLTQAIRGRDARAAFEDAQSFHMTKPATTPPPGVDVGKLRELGSLLVGIRPEFGQPGSRDVDVRAQQNRIDAAIAIIDAAAPGGGNG